VIVTNLMTISFVSGKGGVGKTSLAANFAWVCAKLAKTILVDLDFQNQGASGLLSLYAPLRGGGALAALSTDRQVEESDLVGCGDNLYFLPAVSCASAPEHAALAELVSQPDFPSKVGRLLIDLHDKFGFEIVILDCHGGLDFVSLAAHRVSDHTIVVTEADTVTFNGTLELLDFYEYAEHPCQEARNHTVPNLPQTHADSAPPLKFVVNRLPSKFKWEDLNEVYTKLSKQYRGKLHLSSEVICFIPEEGFVADNFGEYPFFVRLAPKSIFARKIFLLAYKLLGDQIHGEYKPLQRMRNKRYRRKVERTMVSEEAANSRVIIVTYALLSCVYALVMLAAVTAGIVAIAKPVNVTSFLQKAATNNIVKIGLMVSAGIIFAYTTRSGFGLMRYYGNRYRLQRALLLAIGKSLTLWQRISLARLFMLKVGTTVGPILFILTVGLYAVIFALILRGKFT